MIWELFGQFWDSIVAVGEYPIAFFQNIGLAVAGAIGGFFDIIFHNINDIFIFFIYLGVALKTIFLSLISPVVYFFTILRWFFSNAFGQPAVAEVSYIFPSEVLAVFNAIPHWAVVSTILGAIIFFMGGIAIMKLLLKT